jgi:hypothetical protein
MKIASIMNEGVRQSHGLHEVAGHIPSSKALTDTSMLSHFKGLAKKCILFIKSNATVSTRVKHL